MKVDRLTTEQIELIPKHVEKWKNIALSTERLDREYAQTVINSVYKMLGYEQPMLFFFDSPYAACSFIAGQTDKQLTKIFGKPREVDYKLKDWFENKNKEVYSKIDIKEFYKNISDIDYDAQYSLLRGTIGVWEGIDYQIGNHVWQQFNKQQLKKITKYLGEKLYRYFMPGRIIDWRVCSLDYLISIFNLAEEKECWKLYKFLLQLGNYIFLQEKGGIICDRPIKMSFDSDAFLHAEGEPAIQFADGYCLYSYHITTLPSKYGEVYPKDWQPKWLLTENNWQVRKALVKGIGYKKICSKLSVKEIDCWHNFILLAIEISSDFNLVYLLEINTNTAEIERVKEVEPDVQSVQEAASFVENYEEWAIASAESKGLEIPF